MCSCYNYKNYYDLWIIKIKKLIILILVVNYNFIISLKNFKNNIVY